MRGRLHARVASRDIGSTTSLRSTSTALRTASPPLHLHRPPHRLLRSTSTARHHPGRLLRVRTGRGRTYMEGRPIWRGRPPPSIGSTDATDATDATNGLAHEELPSPAGCCATTGDSTIESGGGGGGAGRRGRGAGGGAGGGSRGVGV